VLKFTNNTVKMTVFIFVHQLSTTRLLAWTTCSWKRKNSVAPHRNRRHSSSNDHTV